MKKKKDTLIIKNWADIKLFFHKDRQQILEICNSNAFSIKELSIEMNMNPGSIHNHVSKLFRAGYLKIAKTREVNGIIEKKYVRAAKSFCFAELSGSQNQARNKYISNDIKKEALKILELDSKATASATKVKLSKQKYRQAQEKLKELIQFLHNNNESGSHSVNLISCLGIIDEKL